MNYRILALMGIIVPCFALTNAEIPSYQPLETNKSGYTITITPAPQLPNTYLVDGTNTIPFQESLWRRYDVVFFVAVPISFYLFMNILMIKNAYFYQSAGNYLSDTDWNYIYLTTFLIPLFCAYEDQKWIRNTPSPSFTSEKSWNFTLYSREF